MEEDKGGRSQMKYRRLELSSKISDPDEKLLKLRIRIERIVFVKSVHLEMNGPTTRKFGRRKM